MVYSSEKNTPTRYVSHNMHIRNLVGKNGHLKHENRLISGNQLSTPLHKQNQHTKNKHSVELYHDPSPRETYPPMLSNLFLSLPPLHVREKSRSSDSPPG